MAQSNESKYDELLNYALSNPTETIRLFPVVEATAIKSNEIATIISQHNNTKKRQSESVACLASDLLRVVENIQQRFSDGCEQFQDLESYLAEVCCLLQQLETRVKANENSLGNRVVYEHMKAINNKILLESGAQNIVNKIIDSVVDTPPPEPPNDPDPLLPRTA